MASSGDSVVSGAEKDREHWRFVSVQTRGCLSVTRRSDKQREQQLQLAGYLAMRECAVLGMGDTRLGGGASDIARLTRTALNGLYNDDTNTAACDEAADPADQAQSRPTPLYIVIIRILSEVQETRTRSCWARRGRHGPRRTELEYIQ